MKPSPTCSRPRPNFSSGLGSSLRLPRKVQSAANTGAKIRMKPGLNDWVWAAVMPVSIHRPFTPGKLASWSWLAKMMVWPSRLTTCGAWVMARSTLRSANRFSEVPACSNRVKNTTAPKVNTRARSMRSRWILSHLMVTNQTTKPSDRAMAAPRPQPTRSLRCTRKNTPPAPSTPAR